MKHFSVAKANGRRNAIPLLLDSWNQVESAEQALIREVAEETGIQIESAHYHSSQPWPFPGTLMLGYQAQAASRFDFLK